MISAMSKMMEWLDHHPSAGVIFLLVYSSVALLVAPLALRSWAQFFVWLYANPIRQAVYRWRERRWRARQPKPEKSPYR